MRYVIKDWASNVCFNGREFASYEDAWGYIYEMYPEDTAANDGTFDDYFVWEIA